MMCIGIPMQVMDKQGSYSLCRPYAVAAQDRHHFKMINMQLIDDVPIGSWILTFLDSAREVLSEQTAQQIHKALLALELVMQGKAAGNQELERLFSDLIEHKTQLPPHLI